MQHSWERSHLKLSADTFGEIGQQPTERKKERGVGTVPGGKGKARGKGGESVLDNQTPAQSPLVPSRLLTGWCWASTEKTNGSSSVALQDISAHLDGLRSNLNLLKGVRQGGKQHQP